MALIEFTHKGLFCPAGDFYIDPWLPVNKAIITHAHSDHAKPGSSHYLCHMDSLPILRLRLGDISAHTVNWNETIIINGVRISLHPAGHIIGSSQVRVEHEHETWVISGDYKTEDDGICTPFEPIPCQVFITESTFGLPIYHWQPQNIIYHQIQHWIRKNQESGKTSIIIAYSLGKAQRVLSCIHEVTDNIFVHGAVWNAHQVLQGAGHSLPNVKRITPDTKKDAFKNAVVIAPPSADGSPWMKRFTPYSVGVCSGWMQVRGNVRRRNADAGFVLSDHADWDGLVRSVTATGAEKVYVTHGFQAAFSRFLNEQGIESAEVKTEYGGDEDDPATINNMLTGDGFTEPDETTIKADILPKENESDLTQP